MADAEIPEDLADLAERAGLGLEVAAAALGLLTDAQAVVRRLGASAPTVALTPSVLVPAPALARVAWADVRHRVRGVRGSVAPALAVVRELVGRVGVFDSSVFDGASSPLSVRASVRDLEEATGFGRSTVSEALGVLAHVRLVEIETRAGRTTRFGLRPATFGAVDADDACDAPAVFADAEARIDHAGAAAPPDSATSHPAGARALPADQGGRPDAVGGGAPAATLPPPRAAGSRQLSLPPQSASPASPLVATFAGTPIHAPAGTAIELLCDAAGQWTCRVGPLLVLGPAATPD
jgi:hypothetical protein